MEKIRQAEERKRFVFLSGESKSLLFVPGRYTPDWLNFYYKEKEEEEALEQARQMHEQEHAKQMQKMKIERMREAERRRREAVSEAV